MLFFFFLNCLNIYFVLILSYLAVRLFFLLQFKSRQKKMLKLRFCSKTIIIIIGIPNLSFHLSSGVFGLTPTNTLICAPSRTVYYYFWPQSICNNIVQRAELYTHTRVCIVFHGQSRLLLFVLSVPCSDVIHDFRLMVVRTRLVKTTSYGRARVRRG